MKVIRQNWMTGEKRSRQEKPITPGGWEAGN
jgi:hypothetical protein